jgi:hypothetical protein
MVARVSISFQMDSAFPRDAVTINPHYTTSDPAALVTSLMANLKGSTAVGATFPMTIKAYDAKKAPPSYPIASASNGTGFLASIAPREVALCLSYYSVHNRPTERGRLYIPFHFIGGSLGVRPTPTQQNACLAWANILNTALAGGSNLCIWSRKLQQDFAAYKVWCDDEWDIQRSRGLRGQTRVTANTGP